MSEEEKKAIETIQDSFNHKWKINRRGNEEIKIERNSNYYNAIKTLLNLIEKQQKEIEKLIEGKFREVANKNDYIKNNYISKDKIKKILEFYAYASADNPDETIAFYLDIRRLLEEGKK